MHGWMDGWDWFWMAFMMLFWIAVLRRRRLRGRSPRAASAARTTPVTVGDRNRITVDSVLTRSTAARTSRCLRGYFRCFSRNATRSATCLDISWLR